MNLLRLTLCAALAVSLSAPALADVHADAAKLVDLTMTTGGISAARAAFAPALENARQQGLSEQGVKELKEAAEAFFKKTFEDPEMKKEMTKLIEESYTADDLTAILAFYNSPAGKKNLELTPVLTQKGGAIGQKYAQKNQAEFQAQLMEIYQRNMKPPGGVPAPAEPAVPAPVAPAKPKK